MKRWWIMATLALALVAAAGVAFTRPARSPLVHTGSVHAVGPEVVVRVPWGGTGLGRIEGDEGASEGPMSFAIADDGSVWFLDQVRHRLAMYASDGTLARELSIPEPTFQDFEVRGDEFLLLDRLALRALVVLDKQGRVVRELPIEGAGIPDSGLVTAMLADDSGVWLEVHHTRRVRVLDGSWQACKREVASGRAVASDMQVVAALDGSGGATLAVQHRETQAVVQKARVQLDHPLGRIIWIQADASGDIHAAFHVLELDPHNPSKVLFEQVQGVRYDRWLNQRASWTSPHVIQVWEQFREVRVQRDGTVYQMAFDNAGVSVVRWRWTS